MSTDEKPASPAFALQRLRNLAKESRSKWLSQDVEEVIFYISWLQSRVLELQPDAQER